MAGIDMTGAGSGASLRVSTASAATAQAVAGTAAVTATAAADQPATDSSASAGEVANLISLLADSAPPIDARKVEVIKSLIASGAYPINEHEIATRMLALDFPGHGDGADA